VPDESGKYTQEEVDALVAESKQGLEANRNEVLNDLKKAKAQFKQFEGIDPEKARAALAKLEELERKKAEGEGDWKSLEKQLLERHNQEIEGREGRIKSLQSSLEKYLVDAEAARVISEQRGSVKGLLPHVKPHIRVVEVDGEFVAQVVDGKGNQRIGDAQGRPMTIAQLVEEMKADTDLARLFEGSGSSGGGASKSTGSAGGSRVVTAGDNDAFIANLESIAKGEIQVAG
jgi:ribosomal protein L17